MKPNFYFRLALLALAPTMSALADESPTVAAPKAQNLLLQNIASYAEHGNFSDAARTECPVDISLPKAVAKFANEYGTPVTLGTVAAPETSDKPTVTLQIDNLVGGKFSMSRWVVSELGVTVSVKQGTTEKMSNHFKCNAGPGFAFILSSACSRTRSRRHIGKVNPGARQAEGKSPNPVGGANERLETLDCLVIAACLSGLPAA
jgi:hypothetical protein